MRVKKTQLTKLSIFIGILLLILIYSFTISMGACTDRQEYYTNSKKKVCVAMWYDDAIKEYADIAYEINKKYCKIHDYDIIRSNNRYFDSSQRHPAWERLPLIKKILPNYDYVIWIDADARFNLKSPPLDNLISKFPEKVFIFSQDMDEDGINSGVFIIKNCKIANKFLEKWLIAENEKRFYIHSNWDQEVLRKLYRDNVYNIQKISTILPFGVLQNFSNEGQDKSKNKKYYKNKKNLILHEYGLEKSYIKHYAGEYKDYRIKEMQKYYKRNL